MRKVTETEIAKFETKSCETIGLFLDSTRTTTQTLKSFISSSNNWHQAAGFHKVSPKVLMWSNVRVAKNDERHTLIVEDIGGGVRLIGKVNLVR